jgi:hypothetical protein
MNTHRCPAPVDDLHCALQSRSGVSQSSQQRPGIETAPDGRSLLNILEMPQPGRSSKETPSGSSHIPLANALQIAASLYRSGFHRTAACTRYVPEDNGPSRLAIARQRAYLAVAERSRGGP